VDDVIWRMIGDSITDAVDKYLTKDFIAATISEWGPHQLEVNSTRRPARSAPTSRTLEHYIRHQAIVERRAPSARRRRVRR